MSGTNSAGITTLDGGPDGYRMLRALDKPSIVIEAIADDGASASEDKQPSAPVPDRTPEELEAFRQMRIQAAAERRQNSVTVGGGKSGLSRVTTYRKMVPAPGSAPPAPWIEKTTGAEADTETEAEPTALPQPHAPIQTRAWQDDQGAQQPTNGFAGAYDEGSPWAHMGQEGGNQTQGGENNLTRLQSAVVQIFEKNQGSLFDANFLVFAEKLFELE